MTNLTDEQLAAAKEEGRAWAEREIATRDLGPHLIEWSMGTWKGGQPLGNPSEDEAAEEYDLVRDLAAAEVWNSAG